jgi:hypothetical protein
MEKMRRAFSPFYEVVLGMTRCWVQCVCIKGRAGFLNGELYLGFVFLLIASRNPYAHKSLIWFTVWSSVIHGRSWAFRPSPIRPSAVIWSEMCLRSFSLRSYLQC